jgi:hypothetical protein
MSRHPPKTAARKKQEQRERLARRINADLKSMKDLAPLVNAGASSDPAIQYMQHVAETYGLGYVPPDMGGKTLKVRFKGMIDETVEIVRDLFGPSWRRFIEHVGLPPDAAVLLSGRKYASQSSIIELRLVHMTLLTHIQGIRQDLDDYERKLWVLLQQGHDPQFTGQDGRTSQLAHIKRGRQHMREALGDILKRVPKPYYLPLRALAMIEHPGLDSRTAKELTKQDMLKRGELMKPWVSQSYFDGITDEDLIGLHAPLKKLKNGRFAKHAPGYIRERDWYQKWWWDEYNETGKKPAKNRLLWEQSTWDSYLQARERAHYRIGKNKQAERGAGKAVSSAIDDLSEKDLREYMRIRRMERDAERRRFLNWLDKHNQEDPESAAEKVAKHLDDIEHGEKFDIMDNQSAGWLREKVKVSRNEQPTIDELKQEHTLERMDGLDGTVVEEELAAWELLQGDARWADDDVERAPVRDEKRTTIAKPKKKRAPRKKVVDDSDANQ